MGDSWHSSNWSVCPMPFMQPGVSCWRVWKSDVYTATSTEFKASNPVSLRSNLKLSLLCHRLSAGSVRWNLRLKTPKCGNVLSRNLVEAFHLCSGGTRQKSGYRQPLSWLSFVIKSSVTPRTFWDSALDYIMTVYINIISNSLFTVILLIKSTQPETLSLNKQVNKYIVFCLMGLSERSGWGQ